MAVIHILIGNMNKNNQMPTKMATSKTIEFNANEYQRYYVC